MSLWPTKKVGRMTCRNPLLDADGSAFPKQLAEHGAQRHWGDWFMQQLQTAGARHTQWPDIGIAADEKGWNLRAECAAQPLNDLDPGVVVGQTKIRNDQIRLLLILGQAGQRRT